MKTGRPKKLNINVNVVKDMIEHKFTKHEIAKYFNCSSSMIDKIVFDNNLPKPVRKEIDTKLQKNVIKAVEKNNGVIYKAAKEIGVPYSLAYRTVKKFKRIKAAEEVKQLWLTNNAKSVGKN